MPKNIIMIGPTGVGKTEIARRLAKLTGSPFLKVEASKFTEVAMWARCGVDDSRLVEIAIDMVREERLEEVEDKAEMNAEERLLDVLLPPPPPAAPGTPPTLEGQLTLPAPTATSAPARSSASSSARASWTIARWKSMCATGAHRSSASSVTRTLRTWR